MVRKKSNFGSLAATSAMVTALSVATSAGVAFGAPVFSNSAVVVSAVRAATFTGLANGASLAAYSEDALYITTNGTNLSGISPLFSPGDGRISDFWYPIGGNTTYASIRAVDGAMFTAVDFLLGSGTFPQPTNNVRWQTYRLGMMTGTGLEVAVPNGTTAGWSDPAGFDELRVAAAAASVSPDPGFGSTQAIAIDDVRVSIPACGDAVTDLGEDCDDGNVADGDCCSSICEFEAADAPCTDDDNECTDDACDAFGTCVYSANTEPCDDGNFCTVDDTCGGTICGGSPKNCDDGNACTTDSCDEGTNVCVTAGTPRTPATCNVAPSTKLQIKDSDTAGKDKLQWSWGKGDAFTQADLGTPNVAMGTTYTLCIYDTTATVPSLAASIDIAPSTTLWTSKDPKGLQYKDKAGASEGVTKAQMKTGDATKTKVKISAGGTFLVLPGAATATTFFNQTPSVTVQLVNSAGECWTSAFETADKNEVDSFKAQTK